MKNTVIELSERKTQRLLREIYTLAEAELRKLFNIPENYRLYPKQDDGIDHD